MNESSWEATRREQQKLFRRMVLILLPVLTVAGIIVINNHDVFVRKTPGLQPIVPDPAVSAKPHHSAADPAKTVSTQKIVFSNKKDSAGKDIASEKKTAQNAAISDSGDKIVKKSITTGEETSELLRRTDSAEKGESTSINNEKAESIVINRPDKLFSEQLPPITCYLQSRKDIVIRLSLELFFMDEDKRTTIRMHREDIKVMILKKMLTYELPDLKINTLEVQLQESVNSIFEQSDAISLKIRDIQLEKAIR